MIAELWIKMDSIGFQAMRVLLCVLWQSSILLAAVAGLAFFLRRRRASARHAVWTGALLLVPLLPALTSGIGRLGAPRAEIAALPAYSPPVFPDVAPSALPSTTASERTMARPAPPASAAQPSLTATACPWAWALTGYGVGAMVLLGLVGVGRVRISRWVGNGEAVLEGRTKASLDAARARLGVTRPVSIVESAGVPTPLTVGTFHPVLLLPTGLASRLSETELEAVVLHEAAHVRRNDPLLLTVVSLLRAALYFHPLVWLAARQIANLAEAACDDAVLDAGDEPVSYAHLLARLARELRFRPLSAELSAGVVLARGALLQRVEAILSGNRDRIKRLTRLALVGTVVAAIVSLGAALLLPLGERPMRTAAAAEADAKERSTKAAATPAVDGQRKDANTSAPREPADLLNARMVLCQLRSRYTDDHPKVRQELRRIEVLEASLRRGDPADLRAARAKLAELQAVYAGNHPKVRGALHRIKVLEAAHRRGEPADLRAARARLADLERDRGRDHPDVREALGRIEDIEASVRRGETEGSRAIVEAGFMGSVYPVVAVRITSIREDRGIVIPFGSDDGLKKGDHLLVHDDDGVEQVGEIEAVDVSAIRTVCREVKHRKRRPIKVGQIAVPKDGPIGAIGGHGPIKVIGDLGPAETVSCFVAAAFLGYTPVVSTFSPAGQPVADTIDLFRGIAKVNPAWRFELGGVLTNGKQDAALVVAQHSVVVQRSTGFERGRLCFELRRRDGRWRIEDVDFESKGGVAKELAQFRKRHPNARGTLMAVGDGDMGGGQLTASRSRPSGHSDFEASDDMGMSARVRLILPEVDRQPMMLDLATRQVLPAPDVDEKQVLSAISAGGKGDLVYEHVRGTATAICVRGAKPTTDPKDGRSVVMKAEQDPGSSGGVIAYCHLPMPLPCSIVMTTREGRRFRLTFTKADKKRAELQIEELAAVGRALDLMTPQEIVRPKKRIPSKRVVTDTQMADPAAAGPDSAFTMGTEMAGALKPQRGEPFRGVVEQTLRAGRWLDLSTGRPLRPVDVSSSRPVVMAAKGRPAAVAFHCCATMLLDNKQWEEMDWQTLAVDVAERVSQFGRPIERSFGREMGRRRELLGERQGVLRAAEEKFETARIKLQHGEQRYARVRELHKRGTVSVTELDNAKKEIDVAKTAVVAAERAVSELIPEVRRLNRRVADAQDLFAGNVMRRDVVQEHGHAEVRLIQKRFPRTYGFVAPTGVMGVLQVVDPPDANGDVKIRWRMVEPGAEPPAKGGG